MLIVCDAAMCETCCNAQAAFYMLNEINAQLFARYCMGYYRNDTNLALKAMLRALSTPDLFIILSR
jgi:hypothetical protein